MKTSIQSTVRKVISKEAGHQPGEGTVFAIDGNRIDVKTASSLVIRNVPVVGDVSGLVPGQMVTLKWVGTRPTAISVPDVGNGSGNVGFSTNSVADNDTLENSPFGFRVKKSGVRLEHLAFEPALAGHTHRDLMEQTGWNVDTDGTLYNNEIYLHPEGQISLGAAPDVIKLDAAHATHRLWVGDVDPNNAAFRVTKGGALTATGVTVAGSITATSGVIGGFTVTSNELYAGTGVTRVEMQAAGGFWAGATAIGNAPFSVTVAGVLKATSGTVGGWTLGASQLTAADSDAFINSVTPAIGLGAATDYMVGVGFWVGYNTVTTSAYKLHIGNPAGDNLHFDGNNLTITGYLAGTILAGGTDANTWTINQDLGDVTSGLVFGRTTGGNASVQWNGTVVALDKSITVTGTVTGTQLTANIANGTTPLTITSTTKVSNLNADMVDGVHGVGTAQYQFLMSGANPYTGAWTLVSTLAGDGLTHATGVLAVGVSGLGLSVAADAITLASSSNPGAAAAILASTSAGLLTLVGLTTTAVASLTTPAESWVGPSATDGIYFKGGNRGFGTTAPAAKLQINSSSGDVILLSAGAVGTTGNNLSRIGMDTTLSVATLFLQAERESEAWGNTVIQRLGGNVGIGIYIPLAKTHIAGSIQTQVVDVEELLRITRPQTPSVNYGSSAGFLLGRYSASGPEGASRLDLKLGNGYTDAPDTTIMTWCSSGVGVSTTTPRARVDSLATSGAQFRATYTDNSVYADFTVGSGGNLTVSPTGDFIFDPVGNDVLPATGYDLNLGSLSKKYLTLHAAELWVETLVAQETIATIGGRILVGPTTTLTVDLSDSATTITVKHNEMTTGDIVYLEANGKVEFMSIDSTAGGSAGVYTYTVTRNLDGTGANAWNAGDAIFNTGTTGEEFMDLYSYRSVKSATQYGPAIVGNIRNSATYNDWTECWALGNLNGVYGYGATTYGVAFGKYSAANYLTIDTTNGIRFLDVDDVVRAQLSSTTWTLGNTATEHVSISATSVQIKDGATVYTDLTAGALSLGDVANEYVKVSSSGTQIYDGAVLYATYGATTTIGLTASEHVSISATAIQLKDGATVLTEIGGGNVLVGQTGASQNNVYISSGIISIRNNVTERIGITAAGILTINDSAGAAVITLDASAGAEISKKLTMPGANSAIAIGSTPPTSASAGTGIWIDRIGFYGLLANALRFSVLTDGSGTLGVNGLTWTTAGVVTAAGFTINNAALYTGSKTAYNDANAGVHLGTDGIGFGNNIFTVSAAGALVATSATVTGAITATSGAIGGWTVGATSMTSTGVAIRSGATANIAFGSTPPAAANSGTGLFSDATGMYGLLSNVVQAKFDAVTGAIIAGAGAVILDVNGITIRPSSSAGGTKQTSYSFVEAAGNVETFRLYGCTSATVNQVVSRLYAIARRNSSYFIDIDSPSGYPAVFDMGLGSGSSTGYIYAYAGGSQPPYSYVGISFDAINLIGGVTATSLNVGTATGAGTGDIDFSGTLKKSGTSIASIVYADVAITGLTTSYQNKLFTLPNSIDYTKVVSIVPLDGINDTVYISEVALGVWANVQDAYHAQVSIKLGNAVASTTGSVRVWYTI